ncbi:FkbM family methyltransferase [Aureisphaera sp. CAU 1614]|uniref:FkbM family methyltransferase n=1 Tax=Halomarinibacterium sedimenti TaxID=2857106 RepID=A0A9X1FNK6_9FLAO|nr:FkbM family methyltransferase [Halomarinibacterium sedimenti]MBW2937731.1 FkbM family methyltransferase [Halomarinibacterium sedimenti]
MNNSFLSYSQHADDYIAWQLLGKKTTGMVVEIGAFDGKHLSNSYSLEQLGWQALCVEPNPSIFQFLEANRPHAVLVNKAIVGNETTKEITFYSEEIGVLSGVVYDEEDIKRRYEKRGLAYKSPEKISVAATTLNTLFNENNITHVDILSIDVEGYEVEVLQGLDLTHISVGLFIIEANDATFKSRILQFFEAYKNYVFIGSNFQNLFIMDKRMVMRKHLKTLDFADFIAAKQEHPISEKLAIDAVPPEFVKTDQFHKYVKPFKFF